MPPYKRTPISYEIHLKSDLSGKAKVKPRNSDIIYPSVVDSLKINSQPQEKERKKKIKDLILRD